MSNYDKFEESKRLRLNEKRLNNQGELMTLIKYNGTADIFVKFEDEYGYIVHTSYSNFVKGKVKNIYYKNVFGIGYLGTKKVSNKRAYTVWRHMFSRCYDNHSSQKYKTYKDCEVCEEWQNFKNFEEWFTKNYFEDPFSKNVCQVDKDILIKGNKVYSPKTCCIVPKIINETIREDTDKATHVTKVNNKYRVVISKFGKNFHAGYYNTIEEATEIAKHKKYKYIVELAELYKPYISDELYCCMINYYTRIGLDSPN